MKPSKVEIIMGDKVAKTNYLDEVSIGQLLNATIALMTDVQKMSGMQYKEIFAICAAGLDVQLCKENPTMRASVSDKVAEDS